METRKYVLFIVEGKNDQTEIQAMLRAYCAENFKNKYADTYLPYHGDITFTESEKTIVKKLNDLVLAWRRGEKPIRPFCPVLPSDVAKIVHVIDLDGTFIPEDCVVLGDVGNVEYTEDSIRYMDRDFIIGRNRKKARAIRKLLTIKAVDNVPYDVFFMSCNMDHVLFDTRNPMSKAKGFNARTFASRCKKPEDLANSIFSESVCSNDSLTESWEFIQKDCNSLNRHTNFNLLLQELKA